MHLCVLQDIRRTEMRREAFWCLVFSSRTFLSMSSIYTGVNTNLLRSAVLQFSADLSVWFHFFSNNHVDCVKQQYVEIKKHLRTLRCNEVPSGNLIIFPWASFFSLFQRWKCQAGAFASRFVHLFTHDRKGKRERKYLVKDNIMRQCARQRLKQREWGRLVLQIIHQPDQPDSLQAQPTGLGGSEVLNRKGVETGSEVRKRQRVTEWEWKKIEPKATLVVLSRVVNPKLS